MFSDEQSAFIIVWLYISEFHSMKSKKTTAEEGGNSVVTLELMRKILKCHQGDGTENSLKFLHCAFFITHCRVIKQHNFFYVFMQVNSAVNSLLSRVYPVLFLKKKTSLCATRKYLRNENSLQWTYIRAAPFENCFILRSVKRNAEAFLGGS